MLLEGQSSEARELSGPDASEEGGAREFPKLQLRQASEEEEKEASEEVVRAPDLREAPDGARSSSKTPEEDH